MAEEKPGGAGATEGPATGRTDTPAAEGTGASRTGVVDRITEAALKAADLALGAADYALDAARRLSTQLAGQGTRRRQEIGRRLNLLADRGRRLRLATQSNLDRLGTLLVTRADIERLEARISALEKAARGES